MQDKSCRRSIYNAHRKDLVLLLLTRSRSRHLFTIDYRSSPLMLSLSLLYTYFSRLHGKTNPCILHCLIDIPKPKLCSLLTNRQRKYYCYFSSPLLLRIWRLNISFFFYSILKHKWLLQVLFWLYLVSFTNSHTHGARRCFY